MRYVFEEFAFDTDRRELHRGVSIVSVAPQVFDLLDYATSKFMLPLAGLGAVVFAAWKLDQQGVKAELGLGKFGFSLWTLLSRYVAPVGVLFVFWSNL